MTENTVDRQMSAFNARSFATKRTRKISGLIDTAPPLRRDQIDQLVDQLRAHPVLDEFTTTKTA